MFEEAWPCRRAHRSQHHVGHARLRSKTGAPELLSSRRHCEGRSGLHFHVPEQQDDSGAGDGSFRKTFGEELSKLTDCRNDHDQTAVRALCGYGMENAPDLTDWRNTANRP